MADRAMAWNEHPVDLVSTVGATTVNGLGISTAFGFCDYYTEVMWHLGQDWARYTAMLQINSAN